MDDIRAVIVVWNIILVLDLEANPRTDPYVIHRLLDVAYIPSFSGNFWLFLLLVKHSRVILLTD